MPWIYQVGATIVAVILLCVFSYTAGSNYVQKEWDIAKAKQEAIALHEKAENAKNLVELKDKFKKEIEHAETEAGKRAVAKYLRDAGLLPSTGKLRVSDSGQANIPKGTDSTTSESGLAERIEKFAADCVRDARKVEMCTEFAIRENLPVE